MGVNCDNENENFFVTLYIFLINVA